EVLQLAVNDEPEYEPQHADAEAEEQQRVPVDPQERDLREVGDDEVDLALVVGGGEDRTGAQEREGQADDGHDGRTGDGLQHVLWSLLQGDGQKPAAYRQSHPGMQRSEADMRRLTRPAAFLAGRVSRDMTPGYQSLDGSSTEARVN